MEGYGKQPLIHFVHDFSGQRPSGKTLIIIVSYIEYNDIEFLLMKHVLYWRGSGVIGGEEMSDSCFGIHWKLYVSSLNS